MVTTTMRLLDAWKAQKGITSDNAAAIALGITRATTSRWRSAKGHADAAYAARMAKDLRMDELAVLAAVEADRATKAANRAAWQRHGRGAFMALLVGCSMCLLPAGPGHAGERGPASGGDIASHYAKWWKRRQRNRNSGLPGGSPTRRGTRRNWRPGRRCRYPMPQERRRPTA